MFEWNMSSVYTRVGEGSDINGGVYIMIKEDIQT